MKISVILPCYNAAHYLGECLDSLLAQTMGDFEALLVDDGSTDDTLSIARKYAARDARIQVLHQDNAGVSAARNRALGQAKGEWATFVDGDDILPPDAFETLLSGVGERVDLVVCPHETFDEAGHRELVFPETRWMARQGDARRHAAALRLIEGDRVLNIMCGKLIRMEMIRREGLALHASVRMAEDALFNLEAVLCAREIVYVNRVAYRYRLHAGSATGSRTDSEWQAHLPWLLEMRAMLTRRGDMETYYAPYFNSAVLRLYKDGGIGGVVREFKTKAADILDMPALDRKKMTRQGRRLLALCEKGTYPRVYPLIAVGQILQRKWGEAAFALRAGREKPQ